MIKELHYVWHVLFLNSITAYTKKKVEKTFSLDFNFLVNISLHKNVFKNNFINNSEFNNDTSDVRFVHI